MGAGGFQPGGPQPDKQAGSQGSAAEPVSMEGPTLMAASEVPTLADGSQAGAAPAPSRTGPARYVPGYELLRELGRGGMGVVYEARQEGLDRIVALKMILAGEHAGSEELARFRAEGLAVAKMQHPNIVQVYAVGSHDGLPFFALEYCPRGTLTQRLAAGPMTPEEAAELVAHVARGVHAAHEAGIIHRDLKPSNVLLAKDGTPKVADFGLAKQLDAPLEKTRSGAIMGTPSYMSPEQAGGKIRDLGPATDVYALGAILYEALTGRPPFKEDTLWETLQSVCTQDSVPPRTLRPSVPADLEAVVLQCLDKTPAARYASAADLAEDLARWQHGDPVRAHRRGFLYKARKWLRKRPLTVAAVLAGCGLLITGWFALADAGYAVPGGRVLQQRLDRYEASLFRPAPKPAQLQAAAASTRGALREHLLEMVKAHEGRVDSPTEPADAWTQMQGTVALLSTPDHDHEHYAKCVRALDAIFDSPDPAARFVDGFGWRKPDGNVSGEPVAWSLWALAKTLGTPDLASPEERKLLLARLEQVQTALDSYRCVDAGGKPTGGWNLFAQQKDPSKANIYVTLVMCQGLFELRHAGLPWHGSQQERDRLLRESLGWLLKRFEGRGWSTPSTVEEQFNDGFTLQVFSMLLSAEEAGLVELPAPVLDAIPSLLEETRTWTHEHKSPVALLGAAFRNQDGQDVAWAQRLMRPVWYGWAVSCAARWLARCERSGAPHEELVRTRRVLGHLLLPLGPGAIAEAKKGYTYVSAETLIGVSDVALP